MSLLSTEIYIITFFFTVVLSVFVLLNDHKNRVNILFSLLSFSISLWVLSNILINITYDKFYSLLFVRVAIIWVALLPILFNKFIENLYFASNQKFRKQNRIVLFFSIIITSIIVLLSQTNLNVKSIQFEPWGVGYEPGILYIVLLVYMIIVFGFSFFHLLKITADANESKKSQARFIFYGACITVTLSIFTNIIFPFLGYGFASMFGPPTVLIFLTFIAYSITRHRLFNIRVIAVEIVTFGLWVIILVRTLFAETRQEMLIEVGLLTLTVIFGIMLIRGVLREIQQREKIEKLAGELQTLNSTLEAKVAEQTVEIRRAYEVEKKARMELEKLNDAKDQFIMITQHHLRTPVTGIMWQIESILENVYGKVSGKLEGAVLTMKTSADRLMTIINDFLNITAIKSGTNILNLTVKSLKPALLDVLDEIKLEIDRMKVTVTYPEDGTSWPEVKADHPKMREVLLIIVENAVRYNHEGGTVDITTSTKDGLFTVTVENTGIGITSEEHEKIGTSLFYRGQRARESHAIGMGVGLSVVKAMMKAHHGTFSIESRGEGRGARVVVGVA